MVERFSSVWAGKVKKRLIRCLALVSATAGVEPHLRTTVEDHSQPSRDSSLPDCQFPRKGEDFPSWVRWGYRARWDRARSPPPLAQWTLLLFLGISSSCDTFRRGKK